MNQRCNLCCHSKATTHCTCSKPTLPAANLSEALPMQAAIWQTIFCLHATNPTLMQKLSRLQNNLVPLPFHHQQSSQHLKQQPRQQPRQQLQQQPGQQLQQHPKQHPKQHQRTEPMRYFTTQSASKKNNSKNYF